MKNAKLVELFIYSRQMKSKDGKKKWVKYSTKSLFRMVDVDAETGKRTVSKDWVEHFIDVKFTDDAFNGSTVKLTDIKRGLLKVDASKIGCPDLYEITVDKDGNKVYPVCFIRGGIDSFKPVQKEHAFHFVTEEDTNEVDVEEDND